MSQQLNLVPATSLEPKIHELISNKHKRKIGSFGKIFAYKGIKIRVRSQKTDRSMRSSPGYALQKARSPNSRFFCIDFHLKVENHANSKAVMASDTKYVPVKSA